MMEHDDLLEQVNLSRDSFRVADILPMVRDYGIFKLNIVDAAKLTVVDMWFSGMFPEILEPEDFDGDSNDPHLLSLLEKQFLLFRKRIRESINSGEMVAEYVRKDFENNIIDNETYVDFNVLDQWLEDRGYSSGDIFTDYTDIELKIQERTCDYIVYLRAYAQYKTSFCVNAGIGPLVFSKDTDKISRDDLQSMLMNAIAVNKNLYDKVARIENGKQCQAEKVLSTRQRRTLLTMLAALCKRANVDTTARGAAQRIREMTEELGAPVNDDTIKAILNELPEAIEARMK